MHPDFAIGWVTFGEIQLAAGQVEDAVNSFDHAIGAEYSGPAALYFRANAYYRLGRLDEAQRDLADAAKRDKGEFADEITALRQKLSKPGLPAL